MKYLSRLTRLIEINYIIIKYQIDEFNFAMPWFYPPKYLNYLNPKYWFKNNRLPRGVRMRLALEDLGPIFIKAGQILSTRRDLLPKDIADELSNLQDNVPPFSGVKAEKIIEKSLGKKINKVFNNFKRKPLASASIAQVHTANLLNGASIVIKVLRPKIKKIIDKDIDLIYFLSKITSLSKEGKKLKPDEIVNEISRTLYDELDLMKEAANASQIRRNFDRSDSLYIPEIHWNYCRHNILVMEKIEGIPINDLEAIKKSGFNMPKLAEKGIEIFFTQVFRDSFFHADMHPGNIFVSLKDIENPQYIAVDFGIVGSLNTKDKRYLAENLLAFFKRDYQRVAELHVSSGWLPPNTRIDQFEGAIRSVCEPIFERPLKEISFGQLLLRLFQTARKFNINIQPQLILLQKTLFNIEGLGRQINPDLDLWTAATPYLEKWIKQQVGVKSFIYRIKENIPYWSEKLPEIPNLIYDILSETKNQQENIRFYNDEKNSKKNISLNTFIIGLISGIIISGLIIFFK
ncbi:ubiquinone biosynthesis regulatory protein kinase UbiB [Gammaproteobacteria bacterium]|nr:ubiquinone biosynthesis regulatory protein kinase UbiB [Gammaproteobacteria bacterium]